VASGGKGQCGNFSWPVSGNGSILRLYFLNLGFILTCAWMPIKAVVNDQRGAHENRTKLLHFALMTQDGGAKSNRK